MTIEVEQDETRPRGGYAVLRFFDQTQDPGRVTLRFQPFDETESGTNWPKAKFESVSTRLVGDVLEVVVGPEVVNNIPADISLRVLVDTLGIDDICWWPSLSPEIVSRQTRLPQIERPEVKDWVKSSGTDGNRAEEKTDKQEETKEEEAPEQSTVPTGNGTSQEQQHGRVEQVDPPDPEEEPVTEEEPEPDEPAKPDEPEEETSEPKQGRMWMTLCFLAGLIIGGGAIYGWQSFNPEPKATQTVTAPVPPPAPAPPAPPPPADRSLLEAVDTPDFDTDGASIFSTASREWLRRGDANRTNGDLSAAALNYRRALRTAWYEDNRELGDVIGRLAAVLSTNATRTKDLDRTVRILMELAIVSGDPAGLCRLALLDQKAVGGTPNPTFAEALRARARELASRSGQSDLPQECR